MQGDLQHSGLFEAVNPEVKFAWYGHGVKVVITVEERLSTAMPAWPGYSTVNGPGTELCQRKTSQRQQVGVRADLQPQPAGLRLKSSASVTGGGRQAGRQRSRATRMELSAAFPGQP